MNKYTELIDKYLSGEMNSAEKTDFEKQLEINSELKAEFEIQKQILEGIKYTGIKSEINKGFKRGSFKNKAGKWMLGIATAALAVTTVIVVKNKTFDKNKNIRYELNEENNKNWSEADRQLNSQIFKLNGSQDTVIETEAGIILQIPAKAFLNSTGDDVTEEYELEVKEAMTPLDVMKAGLSTMSDGKLLETGGMFYINARKDGKNLIIPANKSIHANIPDNNPGKNMMLFDGKRMPDGQINWVNPKPMESNLVTVDIRTLDFYPPHFLDSLNSLGFDNENKRITDSIYYSFACYGESEMPFYHYESEGGSVVKRKAQFISDAEKRKMEERAKVIIDSLAMEIAKALKDNPQPEISRTDSSAMPMELEHLDCEIAPSRIHAIWNKKFNNTLLATKEFEARLKEIFKICNHSLLDLYIKNMDKKMYEIDSLAMTMTGSQVFRDFYNKRQGGVSMKSDDLKKLQAYMQEKKVLYEKAALETLRKLYKEENIEDEKAMSERNTHNISEVNRLNEVFKEELETNMKEAYRQLGKPYVKAPAPAYFETTIQTTGWKNVDAYVMESTVKRETLNYTDPQTGKKAVIRFEPFTIKVNESEKYDRVVAYLIPDKLSSFQKMPGAGKAIFKENLNELFTYTTLVLGFKRDDIYSNSLSEVKPGERTVDLKKMSRKDIQKFSDMNGAASRDLLSEFNYQVFEQKDNVRKQKIEKREEIRRRLMPVVFPCAVPQATQQQPVVMDEPAK